MDEAGRLLFTRRGAEPFLNQWDIPGGFLEEGEHPEAGVVREIREETGLEVAVMRYVGVYMDTYGPSAQAEHTLNFYYVCQVTGGAEQAGDDAAALQWFSPEALPEPIAFQNAREALRDWCMQEGISATR